MRGEGFDHLGQPVSEPAQAGDEQPLHGASVGVEIEAGDHRAGVRVGVGRAVADEFGEDMDVAGEQRGAAGAASARDNAALEEVDEVEPFIARGRARLGMARMRFEEMVDCSARGRLAALVEPEVRHHAGIIRTPHARHEARLRGRRHDTGRRSHDVSEAIGGIRRSARPVTPADRPDAASMRIDQGRADRRPRRQAELRRSRAGEAFAEPGTRRDDVGADPGVFLVDELRQADALEELRAPATPVMSEIVPLAGDRAGRALERAGGAPGQIVCQIKKMPSGIEARAHVPLQP